MIGDKIALKKENLPPAQEIVDLIYNDIKFNNNPYVINIAGESGSGKSTLAAGLQFLFEQKSIPTLVFHMDDYFLLPALSNHLAREKDLKHVGVHEVNLKLLDQHLFEIKEQKKLIISKPLSDYMKNEISSEELNLTNIRLVIVEGTYTSLLNNVDKKVFINRTYLDSYEDRKSRARDPIIPFVEKVLAIEHEIIKQHRALCTIILDKNFTITK